MSICWYCHWGWAEPVADLYEKACEDGLEDVLHWGPAHIVFDDENFEDGNVQFCIEACDDVAFYCGDGRFEKAELDACREVLKALLEIPESVRCCEPEDYDGEHPENYPPKVPVRKI